MDLDVKTAPERLARAGWRRCRVGGKVHWWRAGRVCAEPDALELLAAGYGAGVGRDGPRPDMIEWRAGNHILRTLPERPRAPHGALGWRLPAETDWRPLKDLPPEWGIAH